MNVQVPSRHSKLKLEKKHIKSMEETFDDFAIKIRLQKRSSTSELVIKEMT